VPTTIALDDLDAAVAATFERALKSLADHGAVIERIEMAEFHDIGPMNAKGGFAASESYAWHRYLLTSKGDVYDPRVSVRIMRGEAQSAADYGTVTPDADYTWGTPVSLTDLQPGDVIQFRDYTFHSVAVTDTGSATVTDELDGERPHHTAIVASVDGNGAVTVLEQNAPEGSAVSRNRLYFTSGTTTSGHTTTTITVRGTFWFFRPQAR